MSIVGYSLVLPVLFAAISSMLLLFLFRVSRKIIFYATSTFLISGLLTIAYTGSNYFSGRGIDDSVVFHLLYVVDLGLVAQFRGVVALVLLSLAGLLGLTFYAAKFSLRNVETAGLFNRYPVVSLLGATLVLLLSSFSVVAHPAIKDIYRLVSDYFSAANYVAITPPPIVSTPVVAVDTKSFIYVYVESLETIFFDEERYPGLMSKLSPLLKDSVQINDIYQAPHTGWTVAGMVASQCGLPLTTFGERDNSAKNNTAFLPQARCMGDILSAAGYNLTYMGGADLDFAGKGSFYRTHGFNRLLGRKELQSLHGGTLLESEWGVYDDQLLNLAFDEFENLAGKADPFGLVLLTLDTHPPKGHDTPTCYGMRYSVSESDMLSAVYCADRLVAEFVSRFLASPLSQDVVLILASDHLLMGNDAGIREDHMRDNLLTVLNAGKGVYSVERGATMMDVAPTLLHILGFKIEALGLGRNLYMEPPTLYERYGRDEFYERLIKWKYAMWHYWEHDGDIIE